MLERCNTPSASIHTIAFVEDVLSRLAQVSIAGGHGHRYCQKKATR